MNLNLVLSPSGHLKVLQEDGTQFVENGVVEKESTDSRLRNIAKAFSAGSAEGLFTLAADRIDSSLHPSFEYWRGFAAKYLNQVCQTRDGAEKTARRISPPDDGELGFMILSVPPMPGAEYVTRDNLQKLWQELDEWFHQQLGSSRKKLSEFLHERAPLWRQVGRVCFHLAENRNDPEYPFAFLATYAPSVSGSGRVRHQPLNRALQQFAGSKNKNALIKLLSPIYFASESIELIRELLESGDLYRPLAWTPPQAYRFLKDVPLIEESGISIRLPDWWKKRPRPRVGITIGDKRQKKFDVKGMLDFRIEVALGEETLTEEELQSILEENGLILLRGQWIEVDREKLKEALDHWKKVEEQAGKGLTFNDGMRLLAGAPADFGDEPKDFEQQEWSFVDAGKWLDNILKDLRSPELLAATQPGRELKATLREYQITGVNWLVFLSNLRIGCCLADDMGLGKTIQVIALLLVLKKKKIRNPSILVLPASLLANWKSEIERFAPSLRFRFVHLSQVEKDEITCMKDNADRELKDTDVVITTYGMLLRQPWLLDIDWNVAILDEAQAIKNPSARQSKAVKQLKAFSRIALTGTPVENRLADLWSLFDFLCPGLLGTPIKFKKFVKSLDSRVENRYAPLRRLVRPYILRRLKTDKRVIADLPEKTEVQAFCSLSKQQAVLYENLVKDLTKALEGQDGIKRRGLVLAYLMRFKQLCNHPSQLHHDEKFIAKESGKFLRLMEICDEIASRQEKILVFTQFREIAEPLAKLLSGVFGRGGLILHGGTSVKRRKLLVDEFQKEDGPPFFVLSLKAGGTGLNLTAASHVIHFDRWWNPAVENQATDRAFRIGQKRNVLVHKFVCQGTIEERIDALIAEKTQLATDILENGAEKILTEISDSELIEMVSLDLDRVSL